MEFCDGPRYAVHGEGGLNLPIPCQRRVGVVNAEMPKAVEIKSGSDMAFRSCRPVQHRSGLFQTADHTHTHTCKYTR